MIPLGVAEFGCGRGGTGRPADGIWRFVESGGKDTRVKVAP